jgi:hypothetical protein
MRHQKSKGGLAIAFCLIGAHYAWADSMRCGNSLVEAGQSMVSVQALCGDPTSVQRGVSDTGPNEVPVETWTYNRGPNQFLVSIRFVDGKVVWVKTLHEYGH